MRDNRIPTQVFHGELKTGKRPQHKPGKRFKDNLKDNEDVMCIDGQHWKELTFKPYRMDLVYNVTHLRMNVSCMLKLSVIYEEMLTLICQLICSLRYVVCVSACC